MEHKILCEFLKYHRTHSIERAPLSRVPELIREAAKIYMSSLRLQIGEDAGSPINGVSYDHRYNAVQAVRRHYLGEHAVIKKGNCPRCGGTGFILAYSGIRGGRCLQCDGSGVNE